MIYPPFFDMIFLYFFGTLTELFLRVKGYSHNFAEIFSSGICIEKQGLAVLVIYGRTAALVARYDSSPLFKRGVGGDFTRAP
jgi:hypothetical protein